MAAVVADVRRLRLHHTSVYRPEINGKFLRLHDPLVLFQSFRIQVVIVVHLRLVEENRKPQEGVREEGTIENLHHIEGFLICRKIENYQIFLFVQQ